MQPVEIVGLIAFTAVATWVYMIGEGTVQYISSRGPVQEANRTWQQHIAAKRATAARKSKS